VSAFIHTDAGDINLRFVVSVREERVTPTKNNPAKWRKRVTYIEGADVCKTLTDETDFVSPYAPAVAALPAFFVVEIYGEDQGDLILHPVVAWRVVQGYAVPVCVEDLCDRKIHAVLDPAGKVTLSGMCVYDSLEAYRKVRIEELKKECEIIAARVPA
jgi:hypothetical protein